MSDRPGVRRQKRRERVKEYPISRDEFFAALWQVVTPHPVRFVNYTLEQMRTDGIVKKLPDDDSRKGSR